MKLIIVLYVTLLSGFVLNAQSFTGEAYYQTKLMKSVKASDPAMDKTFSELDKASEQTYKLIFDASTSIYKVMPKLDNGFGFTSMSMTGRDGENSEATYYKDIKNKKLVIETDFHDKEFLISDTLSRIKWQTTKETKKIGNYTCYKATTIVKRPEGKKGKGVNIINAAEKLVITAWYTTDIPISQGPKKYWGLPGLIMEINDGKNALLCSKVVLNPKKKEKIVEPKRGTKVSQAQYNTLVAKKIKALEDQYGDEPIIMTQ